MCQTPLFPTPGHFNRQACRHCVALFLLRGQVPTETQANGTLTFVSLGDQAFGITGQHVISAARASDTELATVRGRVQRFPIDSFWQPPPVLPGGEPPDLAVTPVDRGVLTALKKTAVPLERQPDNHPSHGIAVGFPTNIKFRVSVCGGYFVASPCVHVVAANASPDGAIFTLYSEIPAVPSVASLSGISGGPIFWTSAERYGLLGITRSSPEIVPSSPEPGENSFGGGPRLMVRGERITARLLEQWLAIRSAA